MRSVAFLIFMLLTQFSFAAEYFTKKGNLSSFQWAPVFYENSQFTYDIFYYIPQSFETTKGAPALIFMHGGGDSTLTREGAIKTVTRYAPDLIKLAEELKFILVIPSTNGLNWGGHTRGLISSLAGLVRRDLQVDPNNFGLAGHSMGGMGITRSAHWLTDQFSFFLPTAAGMDPKGATEENLISNFNTIYEHQQGLKDSFEVFVERCQNQEKVMKEIETKYNLISGMIVKYYDGPHNYDRPLLKAALEHHFSSTRRNLYQEKLFGSLHLVESKPIENNIQYNLPPVLSYFWVEVLKADYLEKPFRLNFQAEILSSENKIVLRFEKNLEQVRKIRLYVSSKNLDLEKNIIVEINSLPLYSGVVTRNYKTKKYLEVVKTNRQDPSFIYDSFIDIDLTPTP
jgi:hypothetical protein